MILAIAKRQWKAQKIGRKLHPHSPDFRETGRLSFLDPAFQCIPRPSFCPESMMRAGQVSLNIRQIHGYSIWPFFMGVSSSSWRYPNSWMVYKEKNTFKCMITRGTAIDGPPHMEHKDQPSYLRLGSQVTNPLGDGHHDIRNSRETGWGVS